MTNSERPLTMEIFCPIENRGRKTVSFKIKIHQTLLKFVDNMKLIIKLFLSKNMTANTIFSLTQKKIKILELTL